MAGSLYDVLGVSPEATQEQLYAAYRRMALRVHPDVSRESPDVASRTFIAVREAYEVLSDPLRRGLYDSVLRSRNYAAIQVRAREAVSSSNLRSVGYDEFVRVLEIEFRDGSVYQYFGVPREVWQGLMAAPSKGRYFHWTVMPTYPYQRVT